PGLHEQPADRRDLRRRAQRSLEGDRRLAGSPHPHVEHRLRRRLAPGRRNREGSRSRLLHRRPSDALDRREPRELPHLGAAGPPDPEPPARPPPPPPPATPPPPPPPPRPPPPP